MEKIMNNFDWTSLTYNTLYVMYMYTITEKVEEQILKQKSHTKKTFNEFNNKLIEDFKYDLFPEKLTSSNSSNEKLKSSIKYIEALLEVLKKYKNKEFFQEIKDDVCSKDSISFRTIISKLVKYLNDNYNIKKFLTIDYLQKYNSIENIFRDKLFQYIDRLIDIYLFNFKLFLTYCIDKNFNKDFKLEFMYDTDFNKCSENCLFDREQSKNEILRLQSLLEIKNEELIEMENQINIFKDEIEEKEKEIRSLKNEIENNLLTIKMKEQNLKENESDIKYKDDCIKDMESRLKSQKNNNKSDKNKLKNIIKDLKKENEELIKKIAHYGEVNINLKNELILHQKTIDIQKNEIQEYKDKIDDLNKKIYDLNQDNYKLDVQIMEYENYLKIVS